MRKPNVRFLSICAGVSIVLIIVAHFVHAYQAQRTSGILLHTARDLRDKKLISDAAGFYGRYLQIAPSDTDAMAEFALMLADLPSARGLSLQLMEQVLRRNKDYPDVRRRLVDVAIDDEKYSDAKAHLDYLLTQNADDGVLLQLRGYCQEADQDFPGAISSYRRSIEAKPEQTKAYVRLASLQRAQLKDPSAADTVIDQMIERNPGNAEAFYSRAIYWATFKKPQEALTDAKKAIEMDAKSVEYLLLAASISQELGDLINARPYAEHARQLDAKDPRGYLVLCEIAMRENNQPAALQALDEGLIACPDNKDLLTQKASLQIAGSDLEAARQTIAKLRKVSADLNFVDYLEARILLEKGQVVAAIEGFEKVRGRLSNQPNLQKQVDFCLGNCYERVGNLDQRISAYRRALQADSEWESAKMALADALTAAGRIEEASDIYKGIASTGRANDVAQQELTRAMIQQTLQRPQSDRNWQAVEDALARAEQLSPNSAIAVILRAEVLFAQGHIDAAGEILRSACELRPKTVEFWTARSALASRLGQHDQARALLDEAQSKLGDVAQIREQKIIEVLNLKPELAKKSLAELREKRDQFTTDERFDLARYLAAAYNTLQDAEQADAYWTEAVTIRPEWLPGYLALFDAAAKRNDQARLTSLLNDIRRVEGHERGPLWCYGEARRMILLASKGDKSRLKDARNLLDEVRVQRPRWSRALILMAEVEKLDGNIAAAIEDCQAAMEMGDHSPDLIRNLVLLLYDRQRFSEADQLLRKLEEQQTPFSENLRLASEVSWRTEDRERALELAKKAVAESHTVEDCLWLGQLLTSMQRHQEAEQAFRQAVELHPGESRAWTALVQYLVRQKSNEEAAKTLQEAATHLTSEKIALTRAQTLEMTGQFAAAETEYRRALELAPRDVQVLMAVSEYYLRRRNAEAAEGVLQRLLESTLQCSPEDRALARRRMAAVLTTKRDYTKLREALALIEQNERELPNNEEDQRVKAAVLATSKGREERASAIKILERVTARNPTDVDDRFRLAQLYIENGQWSEARRLLEGLLATDASNVAYIETYVRGQLSHNALAEAQNWLEHLESLQPAETPTIELRAEFEVAAGRPENAVRIVKQKLEKSGSGEDIWAAQLLDDVATCHKNTSTTGLLNKSVEELYRAAVQVDSRNLSKAADFLARQGRITDALDLSFSDKIAVDPRVRLVAAVQAVTHQTASSNDRLRVEQEFSTYLKGAANQNAMRTAQGLLYESQSRFDEAINAYGESLRSNPKDIIALNNLAILLAYRGETQKSKQLIDLALEIAGPVPSLLDSRGIVRLKMDDPEAALADFSIAVAEEPSPIHWFHMALAHSGLMHSDEAKRAFREAVAMGLSKQEIRASELSAYSNLNQNLSADGQSPAEVTK